ncbi:benzoate-CoA ligase family protein [Chloroflexi bacterium TSY]|nr:benzoate-CoA ligase family protein [Chloroflexi bacterium TSY]
MKLLITSATSRLAGLLAKGLSEHHQLLMTERSPAQTDFPFTQCALDHTTATNQLVQGMDTIIHIVRPPADANATQQLDMFTRCTYNLLLAASEERVQRVILLGTLEIMQQTDTRYIIDAEPTHRDDFCSLHYTSGTTGEPKGVLHAHKDYPLIAQLSGGNLFGITEADRTFSVAKLFFVYGLGGNLVFPWYVGASSVLYSGSPRMASGVWETIDRFQPTVLISVPTAYIVKMTMRNFAERYNLSSLRLCLSAGEALPPSVWQEWYDKTGLEILDTIGCTESYHTFLANRPGEVRPGSSGKPFPGYEVKIVDDEGEEVPSGQIGNLMVKGESIALFYLHQYEKSRQTFRGEWLVTGDKYYVDADGYHWHAGRGDDMLKVGGLWVSPVEVEGVLTAHSAVRECAVIGAEEKNGLLKPKAFVCLHDKQTPSVGMTRELLTHCGQRLAAYKCPRWIEYVDELPKTATGKIQRFKLRELG